MLRTAKNMRAKGAALVEYIVLTGLIGVTAIFAILQLGGDIRTVFDDSSTTVAERIEEGTPDMGGGDPGGPGGPGGDPLTPNTPGGAPPAPPAVAIDSVTSFQTNGFLAPYCMKSAADPTGNDLWCIGDSLASRPSNFEWRTNGVLVPAMDQGQGAPIWHGQLCMYDTDAGAFVTTLHYVYDGDPDGDPGTADSTMVPGLADYDGTWLFCQNQNKPDVGLQLDNTVAAWDNSEVFWTPSPPGWRRSLPDTAPFTVPPTWSDAFGSLANECVYSEPMQRWLTYSMERTTGVLFGDAVCQ